MDEDKKLINQTLKGDKRAFEMIIQKYQQPLLNYIGRMVGELELALDFTQEVFIRTYSSLHSYQSQYKFSTWLFKIASNFIIDFWRKKKIDAFSLDQKQKWKNDYLPLQVPEEEPSIVKNFAALLCLVLIGIPILLCLIILGLIIKVFGRVVLFFFFGESLMNAFGKSKSSPILIVILGLILVSIIQFIPIFGFLFSFCLSIIGWGVIIRTKFGTTESIFKRTS